MNPRELETSDTLVTGLYRAAFEYSRYGFSASFAFVIFLLVRQANKLIRKRDEAPAGPSEIDLLTEIRDELKKR